MDVELKPQILQKPPVFNNLTQIEIDLFLPFFHPVPP